MEPPPFLDEMQTFENHNNNDDDASRDLQVDCDAYIANVTLLFVFDNRIKIISEFIVESIAVPIVGAFGIVGNVLNLIILTRKRLQHSMDRMEKSANMGLVALAVSDLLVCLVYLLRSLIGQMLYTSPRHTDPRLYFKAYEEALLNIVILCSTWLTVTMAISRYLAVCRPLDARGSISLRTTRLTLVAVFVCSFLCNLPRFWKYEVHRLSCPLLMERTDPNLKSAFRSCQCWYDSKETGRLFSNDSFTFWYGLSYSLVSLFLPLPILIVCNVRLVQALRESLMLQKQCCRSSIGTAVLETNQQMQHRITPTLIGLIVLFLFLVGPSEIIAFFSEYVVERAALEPSDGSHREYHAFQTATTVANFLQLVNFAVNFILYCVVNVQFRRATRQIFKCTGMGRDSQDSRQGDGISLKNFYKSSIGQNNRQTSRRVTSTLSDITAV